MKAGKQFNTLSYGEYLHLLENYRKYTDFNRLGLFRSILENTKLDLEHKLKIRDAAITAFFGPFEFLQLKDPYTYFTLNTLGQTLTVEDERKLWNDIQLNQQKILVSKRIKHRNFGIYSKHECGYATCPLNGLMTRQGTKLGDRHMYFHTDKNQYPSQAKAMRRIQDRKTQARLIAQQLETE